MVHARDEDDVTQFWWASPTRVVYQLGIRLGGYDAPLGTGEPFAINADGTGADLLYGYRAGGTSNTATHIQRATSERGTADFIAAIPDDPDHMLVAISSWDASGFELELPLAYRMDVRDGIKSKITTAPMRGASFVADHQGRIRFAYAQANDGNVRVYQYPIGGGEWKLMRQRSDERSVPWSFSRDDSVVYFNCPASEGGFGMCTWNPATGTWKTAWHNPTVQADSLMQGTAKDDFIGVGFLDGRPGVGLFQGHQADDQVLIGLMKQFPARASSSPQGPATVDSAGSGRPRSGHVLPLRSLDAQAHRAAVAGIVDRSGTDGVQAAVRIRRTRRPEAAGLIVSYPPGEESAKHLPMVVFVHVGPYGIQDDWSFDPYVQAMATRGDEKNVAELYAQIVQFLATSIGSGTTAAAH